MKYKLGKCPVVEPLNIRRCNVFEHTPLDYYQYGKYPRFIRPVGWMQPRTEIVKIYEDGIIVKLEEGLNDEIQNKS